MSRAKYLLTVVLFVSVGIVIFTTALAARQQGDHQKAIREKDPDFSRFPIADFDAPEALDPTLRAARENRGRKYNQKHLAQISENTHQIFSVTDWDVGLPALPVEQSAAIVIGRVMSAQAYVTPDKTGIYCEFGVAVETVIKNDPNKVLPGDTSIVVERNGGKVRMRSGKIVISWVNHQNMPQVGGRYVFFLTYQFQSLNDTGKDFYILTGYELRNCLVHLLDDTQAGHPITRYRGTAESTLLSDLHNSLANGTNHPE